MSSPLDKLNLTDNGINQSFIYDKSISVNNETDKILLTFRIDEDYHIFKLDKNQCQHFMNILLQHMDYILPNDMAHLQKRYTEIHTTKLL